MKLLKLTIAALATVSMCNVSMASTEESAQQAPEFQYWLNDQTGEIVKVNEDATIIEKVDPSTIVIKQQASDEDSLTRPWGRGGWGRGGWGRGGWGRGRWGRWGGWRRHGGWRSIYTCDPYAYPGSAYYCY